MIHLDRSLADEDPSDSPFLKSKDVVVGFESFDHGLSESTVATSSSRPASTSKYLWSTLLKIRGIHHQYIHQRAEMMWLVLMKI